MNVMKRAAGFLTAAAMMLGMMSTMPELELSVSAAVDYPVQQFRFAIGNTNRNLNAVDGSVASDLINGTNTENWTLNYISAGVYEIVSVDTGYVMTNSSGVCTLAPDTDAANQRWNITAVEQDFEGYDLYYKVTSNADSSQALTFQPEGDYVSLDSYSGSAYQKFKLNLKGLEGFAANAQVNGKQKAGTIGGLLGETVFVDTVEECVAAMKRTEPLTIVVTGNLEFNDWDQADQKIEDDKTILGSYSANIIYNSRWRNDDFNGDISITPSNNIVLQNLHFRATELNSNGCGVILVYIYCGRNIWFDHNDFSASFSHNRDVEVGKFIWINTPVVNWSDGCYNGISPDYITISYNHFNNRYWTVAYGTQNTETTRDRTTLMFNKWENCARRTPQIGNGTGHVYNSYHTYSISDPSQQIIAGDGCTMLTEYCYFEGLSGLEFAGGGSSSSPFRDTGSVSASSVGGSASAMNKSFSYSHSWNPGTENYGYSLISANDTKSFCNSYSGSVTKLSDMKYITDSDLWGMVQKKYDCPFLEDLEVSQAKPAAVMNTDVTYQFENVNSGLFLEVAGAEAASGANVQQGTTGALGWKLTDAGEGYYYLYSEVGDGQTYCLDLNYAGTDNGTNLGIWTNDESDARKFKFIDNGDGSYAIVTKCTKDASGVGVVAASTEEGANVVQWACNDSADQKWIAHIRCNGSLMSEVLVRQNAYLDGWTFDDALAVGDLVFNDRPDATYVTLPEELIGAEALLLDCDAKNVSSDLATVTAGEKMILYVGLDKRVSTVPAWLSSWESTGLTAVNSKDVVFNIYALEMEAGEQAVLGTNGQSSTCVNYTVYAVAAEEETTEAPTETTTEPEKIIGDVDASGAVTMVDIVALQKYLLNVGELTDWEAGDLCTDGKINGFDLTAMKKLVIYG